LDCKEGNNCRNSFWVWTDHVVCCVHNRDDAYCEGCKARVAAQAAEEKATAEREAEEKRKEKEELEEARRKAAEEAAKKEEAEEARRKAAEEEAKMRKLLRANSLERLTEPLMSQGFEKLEDLDGLKGGDVEELCTMLALNFKDKLRLREVFAQVQAKGGAPDQAMAEEEKEGKFEAPKLVLGTSTQAAKGILFAVGMDKKEYARKLGQGVDAMEQEWNLAGNEEDKDNFRYVKKGRAKVDMVPHIEKQLKEGRYHGGALSAETFDTGNEGKVLQDFVDAKPSKMAGLSPEEVLALRLYTSSSYPLFNEAMRKGTRPHPIAMTLIYLFEGLKKLRAVDSELDPAGFTKVLWLWRGMKDMSLDFEAFKEKGGTELAPMSTTKSREVALGYSKSQQPMIFKFKARGLSRGVFIGYLSLYPGEEEYLYPPLTYIQAEEDPEQDGNVKIFCVVPQIP